jgi:hypothetical protein
MKWLVFAIFLAAGFSSVLWFESDERKFTPLQQTALGVIALTGWTLVVVLGTVIT